LSVDLPIDDWGVADHIDMKLGNLPYLTGCVSDWDMQERHESRDDQASEPGRNDTTVL
jgi:hypothetical protein